MSALPFPVGMRGTDAEECARLIRQAKELARNLSYQQKIEGATKHLLIELAMHLGSRTLINIRYVGRGEWFATNVNGYTFTLDKKSARAWAWFRRPPVGYAYCPEDR